MLNMGDVLSCLLVRRRIGLRTVETDAVHAARLVALAMLLETRYLPFEVV